MAAPQPERQVSVVCKQEEHCTLSSDKWENITQ